MKLDRVTAVLGLLGVLALAACGDSKYQCDIYSRSPYQRVSTTWYRASSAGDALKTCEAEHAGYDCDCYEDH